MGDREAEVQWVRTRLTESEAPYLALERMQSDAKLSELLGPETWATLLAEVRASRP